MQSGRSAARWPWSGNRSRRQQTQPCKPWLVARGSTASRKSGAHDGQLCADLALTFASSVRLASLARELPPVGGWAAEVVAQYLRARAEGILGAGLAQGLREAMVEVGVPDADRVARALVLAELLLVAEAAAAPLAEEIVWHEYVRAVLGMAVAPVAAAAARAVAASATGYVQARDTVTDPAAPPLTAAGAVAGSSPAAWIARTGVPGRDVATVAHLLAEAGRIDYAARLGPAAQRWQTTAESILRSHGYADCTVRGVGWGGWRAASDSRHCVCVGGGGGATWVHMYP
jgi:hypothetical protein